MSGLLAIAEKAPIVSTFDTQALHLAAEEVRNAYDWHAATYVEQPILAELRRTFIEQVSQGKTPKSCLVAPFGYGKTSTAIGLWKACQEAGLLAVPPISCSSFTELAHAIYDWLKFMLPDFRQDIEREHDKFLASTAEALARRDEQMFGIPFEQGMAAIKDKLQRGYLDFEDASINLLAFVERATDLARLAGYGGLVVTIDEFQQLLGNAGKGVLVALRQLIWGLRTRQLHFGLLITMDPDTERTLADRAGDILHRIKDDGLYLDIRHVYDRDFPSRLWSQYTAAFGLSVDSQHAIDGPALDALGQLCEREDLSNGPRTVINVLQRAALCREAGLERSYNTIDLIDDFLIGHVRFDGDRGILPSLVGELLNFPYFQRSDERTRALKLIAAFPRGCPQQVARTYGLETALRDLSDDLRGEIVTELDDGLALIELQRVGRPANQLNVLLRRYWMQITDQQLFAEDAPRAFTDIVLPLLFPKKTHDLSGWEGLEDVQLQPDGSYTGILVGTSSTSYPLRRIGVVVTTTSPAAISQWEMADIDIKFVLRLDLQRTGVSRLEASVQDKQVEFCLALGRSSETGLRGGLTWIEHYLSPHPISGAVILSLLRYFHQEGNDKRSGRDGERITDTVERLQEWLLAELLPDLLFKEAGFDVTQSGSGAMKQFMYLWMSHRWPEYRTLLLHQHWSALWSDYESALAKVPQPSRTGADRVYGSKVEVAALFKQMRHAGFESRARQYGDLLKLDVWQGNYAEIRFVPHELEMQLASEIRDKQTMPEEDAYDSLRSIGLSQAEAKLLLRLGHTRGLLVREAGVLRLPDVPTATELAAKAQSLRARCIALPDVPAEFLEELDGIIQQPEHQVENVIVTWRLDHLERWLSDAEEQRTKQEIAARYTLRSRLLENLTQLAQPTSNPIRGPLSNHLIALSKRLETERKQLHYAVELAVADIERYNITKAEAVLARVLTWSQKSNLYSRWEGAAQRICQLQASSERLHFMGADTTAEVGQLRDGVDALTSEARAILAQVGSKGLAEIARIEARLIELEQVFGSLRGTREMAYARNVDLLSSRACKVTGMAPLESLPLYDPADDEGSFQRLYRAVAEAISNWVSLLSLLVHNQCTSHRERHAQGNLMADIKATATLSADPDWLLAQSRSEFSKEALKRIAALRKRVEAVSNKLPAEIAAIKFVLIQELSAPNAEAINLSSVLTKLGSGIEQPDLLAELTILQNAGLLSIMVGRPPRLQ